MHHYVDFYTEIPLDINLAWRRIIGWLQTIINDYGQESILYYDKLWKFAWIMTWFFKISRWKLATPKVAVPKLGLGSSCFAELFLMKVV